VGGIPDEEGDGAHFSCRLPLGEVRHVSGLLNKQVGGELGISEITVKAHRGKVIQEMKADSLADLVKMVAKLRFAPALGPNIPSSD
jgi:regulatory LuxR family protein